MFVRQAQTRADLSLLGAMCFAVDRGGQPIVAQEYIPEVICSGKAAGFRDLPYGQLGFLQQPPGGQQSLLGQVFQKTEASQLSELS